MFFYLRIFFLIETVHIFIGRAQHMLTVFNPDNGVSRNKAEQRNTCIPGGCLFYIRNNSNSVHGLNTKLVCRLKTADRFYRVTKKLNTERKLTGERPNVNNSTSYRKLSRFVNKVRTFKSMLQKKFG